LITLSAAAVLVALAGRRLWHRFRGQPDPADLDRPDPSDVPPAELPPADAPPADKDQPVDEERRV
jgi:hypothetical protein